MRGCRSRRERNLAFQSIELELAVSSSGYHASLPSAYDRAKKGRRSWVAVRKGTDVRGWGVPVPRTKREVLGGSGPSGQMRVEALVSNLCPVDLDGRRNLMERTTLELCDREELHFSPLLQE